MSRRLRIGTRGSTLARRQTAWARERLEAAGVRTDVVEIRTTGDALSDVPLSRIEGTAFFTRELDLALIEGRIDLAVHSLKDLPTAETDGIAIAAVGPREDPRDALVGQGPIRWRELKEGATVATSSVRRRAQLLRARPDLRVAEIRGNVDTRLAQLDRRPEWDATVLAVAGLVRLDLAHRIGERLPYDLLLPAPGQGALAVTARADDRDALEVARSALHHAATDACVAAERAVLRVLEGGCQAPVGAVAEWLGAGATAELRLWARLVSPDGRSAVEGCLTGAPAEPDRAAQLGAELGSRLWHDGAQAILAAIRVAPGVRGLEP